MKITLGERCRKCGRKITDNDGVSAPQKVGQRLAWYHMRCWQKKCQEQQRDSAG